MSCGDDYPSLVRLDLTKARVLYVCPVRGVWRVGREVYRACLDVVPHKSFTFAKVWLLLAKFEVRHKNLDAARKVLGQVS